MPARRHAHRRGADAHAQSAVQPASVRPIWRYCAATAPARSPSSPMGGRRLGYLVCWPHVRPWHMSRTQPALRAHLLRPRRVAQAHRGAGAQTLWPSPECGQYGASRYWRRNRRERGDAAMQHAEPVHRRPRDEAPDLHCPYGIARRCHADAACAPCSALVAPVAGLLVSLCAGDGPAAGGQAGGRARLLRNACMRNSSAIFREGAVTVLDDLDGAVIVRSGPGSRAVSSAV